MNQAIIKATEEQYRADPSAATSTPSVTARLADGRAELSAGKFTWHADLAPSLGGAGSAPSPTAYLLGALAGCAVAFIHDTLGPQLGIPLDDVTAVARASTDARGLLAMDGIAADITGIELDISISSPAGDGAIERIRQAWVERCPIYLAVTKPNGVSLRVAGPVAA